MIPILSICICEASRANASTAPAAPSPDALPVSFALSAIYCRSSPIRPVIEDRLAKFCSNREPESDIEDMLSAKFFALDRTAEKFIFFKLAQMSVNLLNCPLVFFVSPAIADMLLLISENVTVTLFLASN